MSKLGAALRRKYRTPQDAIRALGLDSCDIDNVADDKSVVGDDIKGVKQMAEKPVVMTRKAASVMGATYGFLQPKLAADAKLDWASLVGGITTKNYASKKSGLLKGIEKQIKGKLAQDANIDGLVQLLDSLEGAPEPMESGAGLPEANPMTGAPEPPPPAPAPAQASLMGGGAPGGAPPPPKPMPKAPPKAPPMGAPGGEEHGESESDDDDNAELKQFLASKGMNPQDIEQACAMAGAGAGMMEQPEQQEEEGGGMPEEDAGTEIETEETDERADEEDVNKGGGTEDAGTELEFSASEEHADEEDVNEDEPSSFTGMPEVGGGMSGDSDCPEGENVVSKPSGNKAMDSAIKQAALSTMTKMKAEADTQLKKAVDDVKKTQREIRAAENHIRPWVGTLTMGFDSADDVYRAALTSLGVPKLEEIHPTAFRHILELQPRPDRQQHRNVTMDAVATADFEKMYPGASKIEVL